MKSIFYSVPVFFVALVLGVCLAPNLKNQIQTPASPTQVQEQPAVSDKLSQPPSPVADPYIAEFASLPNFEDVEDIFDERPGKLIDVLESGAKYRKNEVVAKSGETWLTLFEKNGNYELQNAKALVKQHRTVSYPGDETDATLSFDKKAKAVFAVKGIPKLEPGKVTTLYHAPTWEEMSRRNLDIPNMANGYKREFELNGEWYTLRVANGRTKDSTKAGVLILEHKDTYQILRQVYWGPHNENTPIGRLLWVGDLDRDGKLDLYFDEFNEKGYFGVELYLSGSAKPNKLVESMATFFTGGC